MSDLKLDLAALIADVRGALDDQMGRGVVDEWRDAGLPPVQAVKTAVVEVAAVAHVVPVVVAPPVTSAWTELAKTSREQASAAVGVGAEGLKRIRDDIGDCRRCGLCKDRTNIVYGVGDVDADLMVIGEGPGHDEDLSGEPFVGPAGQMLDKMLENVLNLQRSQVYIANLVKCRPPGNRNPQPEEVSACRPFLERQIRAVRPKAILLLGSVALKGLLNSPVGIMKQRGQWLSFDNTPVLPTFHPAYLLRNPTDKKLTFADLKVLRERYDEVGGKR